MGIPSCRFKDKTAEQFTCTVCLDVAEDPVLVNGCEHIFCRSCLDGKNVSKCPTCQEPLKNSKWSQIKGSFQWLRGHQEPLKSHKWSEMKGGYKRVYLGLGVKCLNPACDVISNPDNYKDHDGVCPVTFDVCTDCGYKSRRGSNDTHSCTQQLRFNDKMKKMRMEMVEMAKLNSNVTNNFKKLLFVSFTVCIVLSSLYLMTKMETNELKNNLKQELTEMRKEFEDSKKQINEQMLNNLKHERYRYERLSYAFVTYRHIFTNHDHVPVQSQTDYLIGLKAEHMVPRYKLVGEQVDDYIKRNPAPE